MSVAPSNDGSGRQRLDRTGDDARRLVLRHQSAHEGILLDRTLGRGLATLAFGRLARRGRVDDDRGLDLEPHRMAVGFARRRLKALAQRLRAQVLALDTQMPDPL